MSEDAAWSQALPATEVSHKRALEALRAQRSRPTFSRDYTIGGEVERAVHTEVDAQRERRISFMEKRLCEAKGHIENEYGRMRLKGHSARDFERVR